MLLGSYCETSVDQYSIDTDIKLKSPSDKWGEGSDPEMIKKKKKQRCDPGSSVKTSRRRQLLVFQECEGQRSGFCWDPLCKHDPASTSRIPLNPHTHTHTNLNSHVH